MTGRAPHLIPPILLLLPVFEKTCATTQKYAKSHVFLDFEKKRKKRKKNVRIVSQAI